MLILSACALKSSDVEVLLTFPALQAITQLFWVMVILQDVEMNTIGVLEAILK